MTQPGLQATPSHPDRAPVPQGDRELGHHLIPVHAAERPEALRLRRQPLIWSYSHNAMSFRFFFVISPRVFAVVMAAVVAVSGCVDVPVDPEGTLERALGWAPCG